MKFVRDESFRDARGIGVGGLVTQDRRTAASHDRAEVITRQPVLVSEGSQSLSGRSLRCHGREV